MNEITDVFLKKLEESQGNDFCVNRFEYFNRNIKNNLNKP